MCVQYNSGFFVVSTQDLHVFVHGIGHVRFFTTIQKVNVLFTW